MSVMVPVLLLVLCALPCAAQGPGTGKDQEMPPDAAAQDLIVGRLNGREIHGGDLDYDPGRQYQLELHVMKVKLYRKQQAALKEYIDQQLLEQEAAKRRITADELIALINGEAEKETQRFETDKEKIFQEFVKKVQRDFPSFAGDRSGLLPAAPPPTGPLPPDNGPRTAFMEEVKNKVVAMKKTSYLKDARKSFLRELRAQAGIEILLKRPELLRLELTADDRPWLGNKDALITIFSFIDFQCPYCKKMNTTLKELMAGKKGKIKIIARDFPLTSHPEAAVAARAAACADDQGRYWDYHDLLFENQQALDTKRLQEYAGRLGLDEAQFKQCLADDTRRSAVEKDTADALRAGISGTPGLLINGYYVSGSPSLRYLQEVIADIEKGLIPRVAEDMENG